MFQQMNTQVSRVKSCLLSLAFCLAAHVAQACTIPVFRFALDRWEADGFRLVVSAASLKEQETSRLLIPLRGNASANVKIKEDGGASTTEARLMDSRDGDKTLWSGALNAENLQRLLESPARKELLKRILDGESVVWVVVDNGGPEGKAAADRLEKRLRYLEHVIALPPQDPNDPDSQLGPGPALKLKLTVMRVSQTDAAEKLFCAMLAGKKCAATLAKGESFAAPVFGRGRVLGAWPIAELDDTALEDITMFLTGRCSCRVKNESPGWDVLLKVDWDSALRKAQGKRSEVPESRPTRLQPETVRIEPTKK
jgi:hypothetical protein